MRMVMHRIPIAIRHPETNQWVGMHRGKELQDDDPICSDPRFAWLFEDTPPPEELDSVSVTDVGVDGRPVEQATAAPGERRSTRRDRPTK